ncbi:MAG: hypothetical protein Q9201_000912 [Fulgogasparrea decipioides]
MAKRHVDPGAGESRGKRQKLTDDRSAKASIEVITSVKQLQGLLAFSQDAGTDSSRRNIQVFKAFLEIVAYGEDAVIQSSKRAILLRYLESQSISNGEARSIDSFDLVKTWSFAAHSNNERLFSAITAVLALLLKAISRHVEFRDIGRGLCNLLLHHEQLKVLERGLSAQKAKDHLISPCLRLLTEIVSFDGGYSASRTYRLKDVTFKRLDNFLSLRQDTKGFGFSSRRKASIRDNALRYLFANLRLQGHATKTEILGHGKLFRSMFEDIKEDSATIIQEHLTLMKDEVLQDMNIPRRIKGRLFSEQVLESIAMLYGYNIENDLTEEEKQSQAQISELAHTFLLSACTTPAYGILLKQDHQQPGTEIEETNVESNDPAENYTNIGLLSKQPRKRMPIRNRTLASFLQTLRPHASILQRNLVLATFQAAPELVSDYFFRRRNFSFEPKLTATWIGFAAFLHATIDLPIEEQITNSRTNALLPPPISDLIGIILPLPLSAKNLSKCLNQSVPVIKFLAIKILSAAFEKFGKMLCRFRSAIGRGRGFGRAWTLAASELAEEFNQQCPDMNHVIAVFRSCTPESMVLREASARLLSLYYQHLPQKALEQKFDVSLALSAALNDAISTARSSRKLDLEPLVLSHLLDISKCSPDIRWWHKPEPDKLSLFASGLKLCATLGSGLISRSFEALLRSSLNELSSLDSTQGNQLLATLLESLTSTEEWQPASTIFEFLDGCFLRLSKQVVKYHQDFIRLRAHIHPTGSRTSDALHGMLLVVFKEQWPFLQKSVTKSEIQTISLWLSRFLLLLAQNDGNSKLPNHFRELFKDITGNKQFEKLLENPPDKQLPRNDAGAQREPPSGQEFPKALVGRVNQEEQAQEDEWKSPPPPSENEDHPGLGKWKRFDIEESVVEGAMGDLILCLCSKYADIRKQALVELRSWMKGLQTSQYSEREQIYLLTGELVETVRDTIADTALPYFVGVVAAKSCLVLANPLHNLYAKVNKFLNRGPTWNVGKLPSYWVDQILMHLPTIDDGHYKEVSWLLDSLIDGLRTAAVNISDMELYRHCHILERLLSLFASPSLPASCQDKLLTLLFRCVYAGGALLTLRSSDTLLRLNTIVNKPLITQTDFNYITFQPSYTPHRTAVRQHKLSMARPYTRTELEHLRASPLVTRPARLPPAEEWMGYEDPT